MERKVYRDSKGSLYINLGRAVVKPGKTGNEFVKGRFNPRTAPHAVEFDQSGNLFIRSIVGLNQEFAILKGKTGTWFVGLIDGHPRGFDLVEATS
jgi:hypothetical protein